jgi:3-dehydroquinate dehydratase/shikimate dehydrogenase
MICISISQESRRLALADMLNAAPQCDLLEVRLDRFGKAPDVGELLANKPKPVIMSCRRVKDGGQFEGTEEERLAILRQCIISKAEYVEIEVDAAGQIRPFPPAKRVISYTNLQETPDDIADIYREAQSKNADVIKLTTLARTPEEAWPLVQILGRASLPTVVVGLGKPGLMLSILGKKIGAPWTYAALERGMEAYPGEPTVADLRSVYHYDAIDKDSRFIGVSGFGPAEVATAAGLNAGLAHLNVPARCLPLSIGDVATFRKVMDAVHLAGVVVDEPHREAVLPIANDVESVAQKVQAVDLLLRKEKGWHGYNIQCRAAIAALEEALKAKTPSDKPLDGRMAMIVGTNAAARAAAYAVKKRGGAAILAGRDKQAGLALAKEFECRFVQFDAIYSTMHDVLIVCSEEKEQAAIKTRSTEAGLHGSYLKAGMTVLDLTGLPRKTAFAKDAESRGCTVVPPKQVLLAQLELQLKMIAGKDVPRECLTESIQPLVSEED